MRRPSVLQNSAWQLWEISGDVVVLHVGYIPLQQFEKQFWAGVCVCGTSEQTLIFVAGLLYYIFIFAGGHRGPGGPMAN